MNVNLLRENAAADAPAGASALQLRVHGLVQGVGFRPHVYRLAQQHGLRGWVCNDDDGVLMEVDGPAAALATFLHALRAEAPALARIDRIEQSPAAAIAADAGFHIAASRAQAASTPPRAAVLPDAAVCADCAREVLDPFARRFRYPFTNCTQCGPRLSIVRGIPWDRGNTTMQAFAMCAACRAEYDNPADRRFHAEPIACHACGPKAWLERADGAAIAVEALTTLDAVDAVCTLLQRGRIVAIKGTGGFQLACDATRADAVARLRSGKRRERKPFALMVRDLAVLKRHAQVDAAAEALLKSPAAPIVIVPKLPQADGVLPVAVEVAPGVGTLGVMLPNTPLHVLVLRRMDRPIVLTSGNLSDEPQCIGNDEARARLAGVADYFLMHDRDIACRVDDSLVRVVAGEARVWRRARGHAPATLLLPPGFAAAPPVLALGGELKNTFCLLREGEAVLSHHLGDLEEATVQDDYRRALAQYGELFRHHPQAIAIDLHPEYLSGKFGRELAAQRGLPLVEVQHHHAHVAACLAEHGVPLSAPPVLGVVLDGLGYGSDGTLWGGEFLLAGYAGFRRLGTFKPVALPGGAQAMREPWRNTWAQLMAEMGWARFVMNYGELELARFLEDKPRALLDGMLAQGVNSPLASSCGRLFDAVAAAAGVCRERALYEGQAAVEFEALVDERTLHEESDELAYPLAVPLLPGNRLPYVEPLAMWQALLGDLILQTPVPVIAARFHKGLAIVIQRMVTKLARAGDGEPVFNTVVLSGGVFQNRVLLEQVQTRLVADGFRVLCHREVPTGDGGLALGQGVVAMARILAGAAVKE